jgi:hypothetical protein
VTLRQAFFALQIAIYLGVSQKCHDLMIPESDKPDFGNRSIERMENAAAIRIR